jgi:hypothetical protein
MTRRRDDRPYSESVGRPLGRNAAPPMPLPPDAPYIDPATGRLVNHTRTELLHQQYWARKRKEASDAREE